MALHLLCLTLFFILVEHLHELAKKYCGAKCRILRLDGHDEDLIVFKEILSSKLVLVSYDCDFNFEPCNKNGLKAHWALITGFFLPVRSSRFSEMTFVEENNTLLNLNQNHIAEESLLELNQHLNLKDENFVICKHGKSKHSGIWSLNRLIESNRQLKRIDEKKCNDAEFVRPCDGDIGATLSSKVLVFD